MIGITVLSSLQILVSLFISTVIAAKKKNGNQNTPTKFDAPSQNTTTHHPATIFLLQNSPSNITASNIQQQPQPQRSTTDKHVQQSNIRQQREQRRQRRQQQQQTATTTITTVLTYGVCDFAVACTPKFVCVGSGADRRRSIYRRGTLHSLFKLQFVPRSLFDPSFLLIVYFCSHEFSFVRCPSCSYSLSPEQHEVKKKKKKKKRKQKEWKKKQNKRNNRQYATLASFIRGEDRNTILIF